MEKEAPEIEVVEWSPLTGSIKALQLLQSGESFEIVFSGLIAKILAFVFGDEKTAVNQEAVDKLMAVKDDQQLVSGGLK